MGRILIGLTLALSLVVNLEGAPIRVDLSMPGRSDSIAPDYEVWQVEDTASASMTFDGVTVTFTRVGPHGSGLTSGWWKEGATVHEALFASDGITVDGGDAGGQIEMRLSGLTAGPHTLVTYHNTWSNPATHTFSPIDISVGGTEVVTDLAVTNRVTLDSEGTFATLELTAEAGADVVILFAADTTDGAITDKNVCINGFEIDTVAPDRKAINPVPAHLNEHADADDGDVMLKWTGAEGASSHDVYLGTDLEAVQNATTTTAEFVGNVTTTGTLVGELNHMETYYWRVDEVFEGEAPDAGDVWMFRVRHLAFPTAEGWGRFARGGRGGTVYKVTNLNDSGPGSLRAGVEAEGPRTIIFDVSGIIELGSRLSLKNPYCTVAGQTAPGKGICIKDYPFGLLGGNDQIMRHMRVRVGKEKGTDKTYDGIGMASADHSIVDHCSISWTVDEAFSSRSANNITLQRTLISEALHVAGHQNYEPGSSHGFAGSIGGDIGSFHHNLLAHCEGRNWSLAGGLDGGSRHTGSLDIRNNVVYNWDGRTTDGGAEKVNFVRNYYKPGPATGGPFTELRPQFEFPDFGPQQYYVEGNVMEGHHGPEGPEGPFDGVRPSGTQPWPVTVPEPFFEHYVETQTAAGAYDSVLADVGATRPMQDEQDARVIREVREGTFTYRGYVTNDPGLIDNQDDVGGWEDYPEMSRPAGWDTDGDGLPNAWEERHGLNADDPADGNETVEGGYTNLEIYLNVLAGDIEEPAVGAAVRGGVWWGYR